jgi:hypothetical protein
MSFLDALPALANTSSGTLAARGRAAISTALTDELDASEDQYHADVARLRAAIVVTDPHPAVTYSEMTKHLWDIATDPPHPDGRGVFEYAMDVIIEHQRANPR